MDSPHQSFVKANGIKHCVYNFSVQAQASTTPLLILHGIMDSAATFDRLAAELVHKGFDTRGFDWRGHGQSAWVPEGGYYHFYDYIFDLHQLLEQLELDKVHLVAHSMGGTAATLFAGSFPERVTSLTLIEGVGPEDASGESPVSRMQTWVSSSQKVAQRPNKTMTLAEATKRLQLRNAAMNEDALRDVAKKLTHGSSDKLSWRFDPRHRTKSPRAFSSSEYKTFANALRCPLLFVGGSQGFHPKDEEERLRSFSTIRTHTIEGAGHMMHWTHPAELGRIICDFLSSQGEH